MKMESFDLDLQLNHVESVSVGGKENGYLPSQACSVIDSGVAAGQQVCLK
ncbi:MAG: hypothetical protein ACXVP5_06315 [Tumebacillaceae bacterium]